MRKRFSREKNNNNFPFEIVCCHRMCVSFCNLFKFKRKKNLDSGSKSIENPCSIYRNIWVLNPTSFNQRISTFRRIFFIINSTNSSNIFIFLSFICKTQTWKSLQFLKTGSISNGTHHKICPNSLFFLRVSSIFSLIWQTNKLTTAQSNNSESTHSVSFLKEKA